ncbi:hypothetical protein PR001_g7726 [Phytophthora rubi]|uniref:Uncharacterized protein n=2 Tax=Phytophthora rubi TaxID=129364 RepID=A0A6A3N6A5_9STRA|nr:hypothetical protein PR001_g7726 [Phytophthora rubi]
MLEYIQQARHLVSCITTHPIDMATQVHVFVSGMNAGYQRFYLTRKVPMTLEEAFATALREDYSVTASQAFDVSRVQNQSLNPWRWMRFNTTEDVGRRRHQQGQRHRLRRAARVRCVASEPPPSPPVLRAHLFATTSGSDSRLIVLSLHVDGSKRPLRALLDSGAINNFVRAESLSLFPADLNIREGPGDMILNSEEFLVIELSGSFDCVFGIPWLARHQPDIDWLTGTVRPRNIDVNSVLAFLCGMPNQWPHVAVMDPDSMTHSAHEVSDGASCAVCEYATCAGPQQESQDASDVVEHGFPRPDEQRFSEDDVVEHVFPRPVEQWLTSEEDDDDVVQHEFPRPDEQWLSPEEDDDVVEHGFPRPSDLPLAVEHGFPRVVERELPEEVDAADQMAPRLGADVEFRHPESADVIEHGFSLSAVEDTPHPVRRRGRRKPRRPRAPSPDPVDTESEVISVLVGNNADEPQRARNVKVVWCSAPREKWAHRAPEEEGAEMGVDGRE